MTEAQALKIAVACITERMKPYAFGANRYKMDGSRTPANVRDHEEYTRLAEAMLILERMMSQGRLF
jgi:hypothetical protein